VIGRKQQKIDRFKSKGKRVPPTAARAIAGWESELWKGKKQETGTEEVGRTTGQSKSVRQKQDRSPGGGEKAYNRKWKRKTRSLQKGGAQLITKMITITRQRVGIVERIPAVQQGGGLTTSILPRRGKSVRRNLETIFKTAIKNRGGER